MLATITGGAKCGKSSFAQDLAVSLAKKDGLDKYYIATMIPADDEDRLRIERHIKDREGLSFVTVERGLDLAGLDVSAQGVYLLDSVTALLANEMFRGGNADTGAADRIARDLVSLSERTGSLILVSDEVTGETARYDELTESYREGLIRIMRTLSSKADLVVECVYGNRIFHKGVSPMEKTQKETGNDPRFTEFVFGGAYHGKTDYVKNMYGLSDSDISVCTDEITDFENETRCVTHLELYVLACMRKGIDPLPHFLENCKAKILVANEICCGVVPVDAETRKWREETGRFLSVVSKHSSAVTRIYSGLPQHLRAPAHHR